MSAPKTDNKAIDNQPTPGNKFLVQLNVGLSSFEALSHDPENLGKVVGLMNGEGAWSTEHFDHNGNKNEVVHGATKNAAQAAHRDVAGGHDVERVAGGSHSQKKNGSNEENGEAETKGVKGPVVKASESSDKKYSKGGDGHQHHKGDMVTSVEEGGKHFNVAKDFTVTATGKLIKLNSSKEIAFKSGGNETHEVAGNTSFVTSNKTKIISQSDINIISTQSITLRVGDTSIIVSDGKILLTVGDSKGIQIDASGVSLSKGTLWVGDSKPGAHDATPVSPPFKIP